MGFSFPLQTANIVANLTFGRVNECYMEIFRNPNSHRNFMQFLNDYKKYIYSNRMDNYESILSKAREAFLEIGFKQVEPDQHSVFYETAIEVLKKLSSMFEECKFKALLIPGFTRRSSDKNHFMKSKNTLDELVKIHPGESCLILQPRDYMEDKDIFDAFPNFDVALRQADIWPAVMFWENTEKYAFVPISSKEDLIDCFKVVKDNPNPIAELNRRAREKKQHSICLFHLSDLHFGSKNVKESESILKDLIEKEISKGVDEAVSFVITGDMLNSPKESYAKQYKPFAEFLEEQCKEKPVSVFGNHDISRWGLAFRHSNQQLANIIGGFPRIKKFDNQKIILLLFNSYTNGAFAKGEIGTAQMDEMRNLIDEVDNIDEYLLVAVLHHHLVPIERPNILKRGFLDYILPEAVQEKTVELRDKDEFILWLKEHNVKLVLHGHKHIPFMTEIDGITIVGCGSSTGMKKSEITKKSYLTYDLIRICGSSFTCAFIADDVSGVGPRIIHPEVGQW